MLATGMVVAPMQVMRPIEQVAVVQMTAMLTTVAVAAVVLMATPAPEQAVMAAVVLTAALPIELFGNQANRKQNLIHTWHKRAALALLQPHNGDNNEEIPGPCQSSLLKMAISRK